MKVLRLRFDPCGSTVPLGHAGIGIAGDVFDFRIIDRAITPLLGKGDTYRATNDRISSRTRLRPGLTEPLIDRTTSRLTSVGPQEPLARSRVSGSPAMDCRHRSLRGGSILDVNAGSGFNADWHIA
jgi:hypothetical protein